MRLITRDKISLKEKVIILEQLAKLYHANIPLSTCFTMITNLQHKPNIKENLLQIHKQLNEGLPLNEAITHGILFSPTTQQLIRLGEKTGTLESCLLKASSLQTMTLKRIKLIQKALFYPCILILTCSIITIILLTLIVPRFEHVFTNLNVNIPYSTNLLFSISNSFRTHAGKLTASCILFLLVTYFVFSHKQLNLNFHFIPIISQLTQLSDTIHFLTHLHTGISAGLPTIDALIVCLENAPQSHVSTIKHLISTTQLGYPLHRSMRACHNLSPHIIDMTQLGEQSGKLETFLHHTIQSLEDTLEQAIQQLIQLAEPLIMLVLGVLIGGLVIILYLPLFKLGSTIQ